MDLQLGLLVRITKGYVKGVCMGWGWWWRSDKIMDLLGGLDWLTSPKSCKLGMSSPILFVCKGCKQAKPLGEGLWWGWRWWWCFGDNLTKQWDIDNAKDNAKLVC